VTLSTEFWPGWRFEVPAGKAFVATGIGIHARASYDTNLSIFGSLVALTGPKDDPDMLDLSGPDVIQSTVFNLAPGSKGSQNVSAKVNTTLGPGWYAVIFGAGRLGTDGAGTAVGNNTRLSGAQNIFAIRQSDKTVHGQASAARLFVVGYFK
jgi:hypothetical protein